MLLIFACNPAPEDRDGDGVEDARDCAPDEAAVRPGAPEACDGLDQDCDGLADEGLELATSYQDADADGYGNAAVTLRACATPEGFVGTAGDCDDGNATVFPDAPEACDGLDHDCDGQAWEDGAADALVWFLDADGDTFGTGPGARACTGAGVTVAGDCDDADPAVYPGAQEVCDGGGRDEDCDGAVDADDDSAVPGAHWYADHDLDGEGGPEAVVATGCTPPRGYAWTDTDCDDGNASVYTTGWYVDFDGDGYARYAGRLTSCTPLEGRSPDVRDCHDVHGRIHPGAADTCDDGVDADCNGVDCFLNVATDRNEQDGGYGYAVAGGLDLTGDGVPDLVAGFLGPAPGGAVVLPGPIGPNMADGPELLVDHPDVVPGTSLTLADFDLDGQADLAVAASDVRGDSSPGVFLLPGPIVDDVDLVKTAHRLALLGDGLAGPLVELSEDLTGDGAPDFVFGYPDDADSAIYVVSSGFRGEVDVRGTYAAAVWPASEDARVGFAYNGDDDLDGDGLDDLVTGTDVDEFPGETIHRLAIVLGPFTGDVSLGSADMVLDGATEEDGYLGDSLQVLPDIDGDGIADVLASSSPDLVVLSSYQAGSWTLWQQTRARLLDVFELGQEGPFCGGDFDMDLRGDVAVGSPDTDREAGAVYVYSGPLLGELDRSYRRATWEGLADGMELGWAMANVGDVDGGGRDTLAVSAMSPPDRRGGSGTVYLVLGAEIP